MLKLINFILSLPLPLIDHWGYLVVFLSALIEALPALGSLFPGHTIVILSGFFAQLGVLKLGASMAAATAGAFIGDLIAYWIGRGYGQAFLARYGKYFFFNQARYEATKRLVNEHAGKTLILGRFNTFTRAFAPFVAGVSRVRFSIFILYALLGGAAWAVTSVLIGYVFGLGFSAAARYLGWLVLGALVLMILLVVGYRQLNKRRHVFAKYHVYYLSLNLAAIYVFSKMAEDYFDRESTYRLDLWLNGNVMALWRPWLTKFMILVSQVFSPEVLAGAALIVAVYYFIKKRWYQSALIFLSTAGGLAFGQAVKWLVARPRPADSLITETGFSFPSQHALTAAIFFSLLMFGLAGKIKRRWLEYCFIAVSLALILLISFSRLYLRVHWLSDVLAGLALGVFWLTFLILFFRIAGKLFKR